MHAWSEIDRRLYRGQARVATAEQVQQQIEAQGIEAAAQGVDLLVTATFAPVSWALLFFRPSLPAPIQSIEGAWLSGVPLQSGFSSGEMVLSADATDDRNQQRGGAHLLDVWLAGDRLPLRVQPRPSPSSAQSAWEGSIGLTDLAYARLLIVLRSAVQGWAAVNSHSHALPSACGLLLPDMGNAAHTWMGGWEPALLDPSGRMVLPGWPVLLAGSVGRVAWRQGTTIALSADFRTMRREYLRPLTVPNWGVGLSVGVAWPVPVAQPQVLSPLERQGERLSVQIRDYGPPQRPFSPLGQVAYGDLLAGTIHVAGRQVPVTTLSSLHRAARLAEVLKARLLRREFPPLSPPTIDQGEEAVGS